ncbi:MAG: pentapeptide repeat-containing protein [Legionellaceae bacterium]|nr:pentapeptide repeat-containing protein [Legionellaceae bacterium]
MPTYSQHSSYTAVQQEYRRLLKAHLDGQLNHFFQSAPSTASSIEALYQISDKGNALIGSVTTVTAAVTMVAATGPVAPIAATAATITGGVFVLVNTAHQAYKMLHKETLPKDGVSFDKSHVSLDEHLLLWRVALYKVADMLTQRYSHFMIENIEATELPDMAEYGAERIMKKIEEDFNALRKSAQPIDMSAIKAILDVNHLSSYLLDESVNLSTFHTKRLTVKTSFGFFNSAHDLPVKWAYGRANVAYYTFDPTKNSVGFHYYKSPRQSNYDYNTTLDACGYATLSTTDTTFQKFTYRNSRKLKKITSAHKIPQITPHFCIPYPVSAEEVLAYQASIQQAMSTPPESLNRFLSNRLGVRVIASCHDDRLKNLDLSHGNYEDVDFSHATLSGDLRHSTWHNAQLAYTQFIECLVENASFQDAVLIFSEWHCIYLESVNFSSAMLCSAKIIDSTMGTLILINCDTRFMVLENVQTHNQDDITAYLASLATQMNDTYKALQEEQDALADELQTFKLRQERINQSLDARVTQLEQGHIQTQLESLIQRSREFAEACFEQGQNINHVALNIKQKNMSEPREMLYQDALIDFHGGEQTVLLIHGPILSGKTLGIYRALAHFTEYPPIVIKLKEVYEHSNFLVAALRTRYSDAEIELLQEHTKQTVILDGLDECRNIDLSERYILEECLQFTQKCSAPWKIILVTTTEALISNGNHHEKFRLASGRPFASYGIEYEIMSPNQEQVQVYLRTYYPDSIGFIQERLARIPTLIQTVGMLSIACDLLSESKDVSEALNSPIEFIESFMVHWSRSALHKKAHPKLNAESIQLCIQDYSFAMYVQGTPYIARPKKERNILVQAKAHDDANTNTFNYLYESEVWRAVSKISPIVFVEHDNEIRCYIKPPFNFYGLAKKLIDTLYNSPTPTEASATLIECLETWNHAHLTQKDYLPVLDALYRLAQQPKYASHITVMLHGMITASRGPAGERWSKAASNAITLLFMLDKNAARDLPADAWRGIHVPYAKLPGANLSHLDLSASDFSYAYLYGAKLAFTNMSRARLTHTIFSEALSQIDIGERPERIAIYPSEDPIIAYVIPKEPGSEQRVIKLIDKHGKAYTGIDAHHTEIRDMAWGVMQGEDKPYAALATTSVYGRSIHIWHIEGSQWKKICSFRTDKSMRINSLHWHETGTLLASGGEDNRLRLWSLKRQELVLEYQTEHAIQSVLFGKDKLFVAGNERLFQVFTLSNNEPELSTPMLPDVTTDILCLALSPDENQLAMGCANGEIYLVDLSDDNEPYIQCTGHRDAINAISWSAPCLVSSSQDGTMSVWDPITGHKKATYHGDGSAITQIIWCESRHEIIVAQARSIAFFSPYFNAELAPSEHHLRPNTAIAATHGCLATAHNDGCVWLRSTASAISFNATLLLEKHPQTITHLCWSPDGDYLAVGDQSNHVYCFSILIQDDTIGHDPCDVLISLEAPIQNMCFENNDDNALQLVVTTETHVHTHTMSGSVSQVKTQDSIMQQRVYAPDNSVYACINEAQRVCVFDAYTHTELWKDPSVQQNPRFIWTQQASTNYLMIATSCDLRAFQVVSGKVDKHPTKTMSSGMMQWGATPQHLFLMSPNRIDMLNLEAWLSPVPQSPIWVMGWGFMHLRELSIHGATLDDATKSLLQASGAIVSAASFFSRLNVKLPFFTSDSKVTTQQTPPTPSVRLRRDLRVSRSKSVWWLERRNSGNQEVTRGKRLSMTDSSSQDQDQDQEPTTRDRKYDRSVSSSDVVLHMK